MLCSAELCVECRPCEIFYDSKACEFLDVRDALEALDEPVPSPMGDQSPNPRITPSNRSNFILNKHWTLRKTEESPCYAAWMTTETAL